MPGLNTARKNTVLLILLLFLQLLLMSRSAGEAEDSGTPETWIMRFTWPAVSVARSVGDTLRGVSSSAGELLHAHTRNAVLEAQLARLGIDAQRSREAVEENRRLRSLLRMREALVPESLAAAVVVSSLDGPTKLIVVDRGSQEGVRPYLPVVTWGGAVGRVVVAGVHHSKVRLLTDPNSGVAAVVQRSRAQGLVLGRADGGLDLLYVPRFSDVMHGDRVVTSGLDGIFPRGFGIGIVSAITEAPDGAQTIHLEPELDFRSLEEVLIVLEPIPGEDDLTAATGEEAE